MGQVDGWILWKLRVSETYSKVLCRNLRSDRNRIRKEKHGVFRKGPLEEKKGFNALCGGGAVDSRSMPRRKDR